MDLSEDARRQMVDTPRLQRHSRHGLGCHPRENRGTLIGRAIVDYDECGVGDLLFAEAPHRGFEIGRFVPRGDDHGDASGEDVRTQEVLQVASALGGEQREVPEESDREGECERDPVQGRHGPRYGVEGRVSPRLSIPKPRGIGIRTGDRARTAR